MKTEGKKVALYARVSTADQTPENQLLDMRKHCAARGWTIVKEFIDLGISGAKTDRPALRELMEASRKRFVDGVLVWRFDRFARSLSHLVSALAEFSEYGVSFTSYSENIDTATPQGKMVFAIIAAMAEFERDLITDRIHAGIRRASTCKICAHPKHRTSVCPECGCDRYESRKHLGRPGLPESTVAEILALHASSDRPSYKTIATKLELSKSVVGKIIASARPQKQGASTK